jgi:hypothetical protein
VKPTSTRIIAGVVAIAVIAAASALVLARVRDNDGGDDPSWWEPLLAFAPPEAAGGSVVLSNAEQIYDKEGLPAPAVCKFEPSSIRTEEESRAESSTRQFYQALFLPDAGLGFDACQVRRYLGLSYESPAIELQVFDASVSDDEVSASLVAAGYQKEIAAGLTVYSAPPRDLEDVQVALGIFDSIRYVTIVDEFVVTSNDRDALVEAASLNREAAAIPEERELLVALEQFDAVLILDDGWSPRAASLDQIVIRKCGLNCTATQSQAIRESVGEQFEAWGVLGVPRRTSVALRVARDDQDAMIVALSYDDGSAMEAAAELKVRLDSYEGVSIDRPKCDSVETQATQVSDLATIITICRGVRAGSWTQLILGEDSIIFGESVE